MKTKRINRITSLILALVMLASMIALPVYAEENEAEGKVFADVDFEEAVVNQVEVPPAEEGGEPTFVPGTTIDKASAGLADVHPHVSIGEDDTHGKYAIVPLRGEFAAGDKSNYDKSIFVQHPAVSYAETQGVSIELDVFLNYVPVGETPKEPTIEFQLRSIEHAPLVSGATSTNFITFGQVNMKTGEFTLTSAAKLGQKGLNVGEWNKLRFDLDLANGTFDIYVNGQKYATYGSLGGAKNIVIPASKLIIAKCNKIDAFVNDDSVANTEMSYVAVDNIKFFENLDFVPPTPEPVVPYAIYNDSLQSKPLGMNPKIAGYKGAPSSAIITNDIEDSSNQVIKVDFKGVGVHDYYLVASTNKKSYQFEDGKYSIEEIEQEGTKVSMFNGTSSGGHTISVPVDLIWGDSEEERGAHPTSDYAITAMKDVTDGSGSCNWYLTTGEYADAKYGAGNVASGLQPRHPALASADYDTVVLNVDYYFSEDAAGKMEIQMNAIFALKADPNVKSGSAWIDIATVEAKKNSDSVTFTGTSNYHLVCGVYPTVKKGEWFTLSAVFDMQTGYEDLYINGSYAFTQKPHSSYSIGGTTVNEADFYLHSISQDSLSVGKIQRSMAPAQLSGFYMIDNINFSTGEVLLGEQYEKTYIENFDELDPETVDFSETTFGKNIPSSVVLASDETHASALKLVMGEPMDAETAAAPVLYRQSDNVMHRVATVNEEDLSVVLASGGDPIVPTKQGKYTVGDSSGFILGTYQDYVNYWAVYEDKTAAKNVDKQWLFQNPGISYATKSRIATDVEIFIPEGASGEISSQIMKGAGTKNGSKADFSFLGLYSINLATGRVKLGSAEGYMNIGEWNTVSLAINMVTGIASLYVNNFHVGDVDLGYTNMAFYENNWILAKVARKQDPKKSPLEGYVLIDDVRFFTVTNQLVTVDSKLENVTEVRFNGEVVPDGTKLFITEDVPYETDTFNVEGYEDLVTEAYSYDHMVAVRSNAPIGLRFTSYVDQDLLAELLEEYEGTVTYGTVIMPSSAVATVDEITRPELDLRGIEYLEIRTQSFYGNEYLENAYDFDFEGVFAGSIIGLKEGNISRDFSAVGYVEIALSTGGSIVLYTDEMTANLKNLAEAYLNEVDDIPDDISWVLNGFAIGRYPAGYVKDYTDPETEVVPPVEGEVVA